MTEQDTSVRGDLLNEGKARDARGDTMPARQGHRVENESPGRPSGFPCREPDFVAARRPGQPEHFAPPTGEHPSLTAEINDCDLVLTGFIVEGHIEFNEPNPVSVWREPWVPDASARPRIVQNGADRVFEPAVPAHHVRDDQRISLRRPVGIIDVVSQFSRSLARQRYQRQRAAAVVQADGQCSRRGNRQQVGAR